MPGFSNRGWHIGLGHCRRLAAAAWLPPPLLSRGTPTSQAAGPSQAAAMDLAGYQALVWSLSGVLLAFFAGFAIIYTYIRHKRQQDKIHFDQEEFITARRQVRLGGQLAAQAAGPAGTAARAGRRRGAAGMHERGREGGREGGTRAVASRQHRPPLPRSSHPAPAGLHRAHRLVLLCRSAGRLGHLLPARLHRLGLQLRRRRHRPRLLLPLLRPARHHDRVRWGGHPGEAARGAGVVGTGAGGGGRSGGREVEERGRQAAG